MVDLAQLGIAGLVPLPNGVQVNFLVEGLHQRHDVGYDSGVGRQLRLLHFWGKGWRLIQIKRQGYVLREVARGIRRLVLPVKCAQWSDHFLSSSGIFNCLGDRRAYLPAQRVGPIQLLVVAAGVDRGENGEKRLARFEGNLRRILREASPRRSCGHANGEGKSNHLSQECPSDFRHRR